MSGDNKKTVKPKIVLDLSNQLNIDDNNNNNNKETKKNVKPKIILNGGNNLINNNSIDTDSDDELSESSSTDYFTDNEYDSNTDNSETLSKNTDHEIDKKTFEKMLEMYSELQKNKEVKKRKKKRKKKVNHKNKESKLDEFTKSFVPADLENKDYILQAENLAKKSGNYFAIIFSIFTFLIIAGLVIYAEPLTRFANDITGTKVEQKPIPVLNMTNVFPSAKCFDINRQTFKTHSESEEWIVLDHSLNTHLIKKNFQVISAFRVGKPYCYSKLRISNAIIDMLNPEILSYSIDKISKPQETSYNCPVNSKWIERSDVLLISYLDPIQLDKRLIRLENQTAWAFQHEFIYNQGRDMCKNEDKGLDTLKEIFFRGKLQKTKNIH